MSSFMHGKNTSGVEVSNISQHGIWLLAHDKEMFLAYDDFPWFRDQPVKHILAVEEVSPGHYYWPEMDIDLTEEMISHPENFPLTAKNH